MQSKKKLMKFLNAAGQRMYYNHTVTEKDSAF